MQQPTKKQRCVVADDIRASRELLLRWLKEMNIEAMLADDGQEAWRMIQAETPDLVITDIEMPNMTGLELLCCIHESSSKRINDVPVIVITSLQDQALASVVQKFKGTTAISKPLNKKLTQQVVEQVLNRGTVKEIYESENAIELGGAGPAISPTFRQLVRKAIRDQQ